MLSRILLLLLASAAIAWAQQPKAPRLPRIDRNACPFECCQFGIWTAIQKVEVFSDWRPSRKRTFFVDKGLTVKAVTGVHITYRPQKLRALKSIPELQIHRGDSVLTYMYHGEGYFDFWVNGFSGNDQIYTSLKCADVKAGETEPFCIVEPGKSEWWIQIKTAEGRTGWIEGNRAFTGSDACG